MTADAFLEKRQSVTLIYCSKAILSFEKCQDLLYSSALSCHLEEA